MHTQVTAPEIVGQEKEIVAGLTQSDPGKIEFNDAGWDSRVYVVNGGEYFFKFPRSAKIQSRYAQELAILDIAARYDGPVRMPEVVWRHDGNEYFGYKGVPGVPLKQTLDGMDPAEKQRIGAELGDFLRYLHGCQVDGARDNLVEREIAQLQEWYEPAVPVLRKEFSASDQQKLENLIRHVWPERMQRLGRKAVICHGDFHFGNILCDEQRALGVIDFGDAGYYDHSKDFVDLNDPDIFESCIRAYGDSPELRQKIAVRTAATRIITLTARIGKDDAAGVHETLAVIRDDMPEWSGDNRI